MIRNIVYAKRLKADKFPEVKRLEKKDFNVCKDTISDLYKGDINRGYLVGKLTGVLRPRIIGDQSLLQGLIAVPRDQAISQNIDYIPVIFTEEMFELNKEKLLADKVVYIGSYQSISINEERFQYFKPIGFDFGADKYKKRNNSIHLGGTILKKPYVKQFNLNNVVKSVIMVNTSSQNNIIPIYIRASKISGQMFRDTVDVGDRVELLGRAQSHELKNSKIGMNFTNVISVGYIKSIVYKDNNEDVVFKDIQEEC